jgi:hypothetical protein
MAPLSLREGATLNDPVDFEGIDPGRPPVLCFFRVGAYRVPEAGDYFISGAIPSAYRATHRLGRPYRIIVPTHRAKRVTTYERGEPLPTFA